MSTVADFNRIEDCDKIDPLCIDAYTDFGLSPNDDTSIYIRTPWGGGDIDLEGIVKKAETLTTLYLSPEDNPNCLVYEPERGDNICINGNDLSRIISMTKLKDVSQDSPISDGDVYIFNSVTGKFEPYALATTITNIQNNITDLQNRMSTLEQLVSSYNNRIQQLEEKLTPPSDAPSNVKVVFGNINSYSDSNAAINSSGVITSLDKTHGLYTHTLASTAYGDEIFG